MVYFNNLDILERIKPYIGIDKKLTELDCLINRAREIKLAKDVKNAADLLAYVNKEYPQEVTAHSQNKRQAIDLNDILDSLENMLTDMAEKRLSILQGTNK